MSISPTPSEEEAAAITAALFTVMASGGGAVAQPDAVPPWRFSGRWWRVAPRTWPMAAFPDRVRPV